MCLKNEIENLKRLAKRDHIYAQYHLAKRYYEGTGGLQEDSLLTNYWLKKSVKQGYAYSQYALGIEYKKRKCINWPWNG